MKHPLHIILPRIRSAAPAPMPAQTMGDSVQPLAREALDMEGDARNSPSRIMRLLRHEDVRVLLLAMVLAPFVLGVCALLYAL